MKIEQKFNLNVVGQGSQPIVFLHGFGCDQSMWHFVTPAFEARYSIVLFDLIGAGKSDSSAYDKTNYSDLRGYAKDLNEVCSSLNLKNVIFVGHSVAAMIGVLAAIEEPQHYSKMILIGPSPCYFNDESYKGGFNRSDLVSMLENADNDYLGWAMSMAPAIMGNADRPELGIELTNSFCRTNPEIARHFARVVFLSDNRADLPKMNLPALILQCSQDIVAPESVGKYTHSQLLKSEFIQLKAVGHCPHVSHPEETIVAITKYLEAASA